jgi:3-oxoacyl-[acyl-carrier-protein] synthase II
VPVTAFKGVFGHSMAASGPLDCVVALCALGAGEIPPICGCDDPDERCGLRLVLGHPLDTSSQVSVVVSTGLGGQACALALGRGD